MAASGLTPSAGAAGIRALVVAPCDRAAWEKNSTTASSQLYWLSRSPANAWISTMLPFTKTLPSQAAQHADTGGHTGLEGRHVGDLGRVQFAEQYHQGGGGEHDAHDGAIAGIGGLLMRPTLPEMAVANHHGHDSDERYDGSLHKAISTWLVPL